MWVSWLFACSTGWDAPSTSGPGDSEAEDTAPIAWDSGGGVDTDTGLGPEDTGEPQDTEPQDTEDTGEPPVPDPCAGLGQELCWVRSNPMVLSGLTPSMGAPPSSAVASYTRDFGANTAHLWQNGLPDEVDGWRTHWGSDYRFIAWVQADGTSSANNQVLGGIGAGAPGLVAYQVGDEPHDLAELEAIGVGIDAVRAVDPNANIVVNFSAGRDEIEAMFTHYGEELGGGIFSYDRYSYGYAEYEDLLRVRSAALRYGMPYWRYLRSYEDTGNSNWPLESDLRWQAYSGLTYGYTGHHWFVYQISGIHAVVSAFFESPDTWSGETALYGIAAALNQELAQLGEVITQLTSTDVRFVPASTLYVPEDHALWSPGAGGDRWLTAVEPVGLEFWEFNDLILGFFEDDAGEQYLMVQNGNHESASWPLWTHDRVDVALTFDFAGAPASLDTSVVEVFDAKTGRVSQVALQGGVLEVELLAGEGVLMKYATGADWARWAP